MPELRDKPESQPPTKGDEDPHCQTKDSPINASTSTSFAIQKLISFHTTLRRDYIQARLAIEQDFCNRRATQQYSATTSLIPHFWLSALSHHHPLLAHWIQPNDRPALEHLTNISCTDRQDGFTLTFTFDSANNPYFTNRNLSKHYTVPNLHSTPHTIEPILQEVHGCTIDWKQDDDDVKKDSSTDDNNTKSRCLTHTIVTKTQRGKGKRAGQQRQVHHQQPVPSLFHWFQLPPTTTTTGTAISEQMQAALEEDYQIAQALRCDLIPNAIVWYIGEEAATATAPGEDAQQQPGGVEVVEKDEDTDTTPEDVYGGQACLQNILGQKE